MLIPKKSIFHKQVTFFKSYMLLEARTDFTKCVFLFTVVSVISCVSRSYLVLGSLWILLDFTLNGVRMYTLQLLERDTFNPSLRIPPGRPYNR